MGSDHSWASELLIESIRILRVGWSGFDDAVLQHLGLRGTCADHAHTRCFYLQPLNHGNLTTNMYSTDNFANAITVSSSAMTRQEIINNGHDLRCWIGLFFIKYTCIQWTV